MGDVGDCDAIAITGCVADVLQMKCRAGLRMC